MTAPPPPSPSLKTHLVLHGARSIEDISQASTLSNKDIVAVHPIHLFPPPPPSLPLHSTPPFPPPPPVQRFSVSSVTPGM